MGCNSNSRIVVCLVSLILASRIAHYSLLILFSCPLIILILNLLIRTLFFSRLCVSYRCDHRLIVFRLHEKLFQPSSRWISLYHPSSPLTDCSFFSLTDCLIILLQVFVSFSMSHSPHSMCMLYLTLCERRWKKGSLLLSACIVYQRGIGRRTDAHSTHRNVARYKDWVSQMLEPKTMLTRNFLLFW